MNKRAVCGKLLIGLILSLGILFSPNVVVGETFFGDVNTGMIEMKEFKYPVLVYVPETIKPGRKYPLIITMPRPGEEPKDNIKKWTDIADQRSVLILAPTFKRLEDLPTEWDRWFFEVKSLVQSAYPVNHKKIYLIGEEGSGPYVSYLGVVYPEDFSVVTVLDGKLGGHFEQIMPLSDKRQQQVPFYVVLKEGEQDLIQDAERRALDFQDKGYPVEVKTFPADTEFHKRDFKKELIQTLETKNESWQVVLIENKESFKERFRKATKEFFTV